MSYSDFVEMLHRQNRSSRGAWDRCNEPAWMARIALDAGIDAAIIIATCDLSRLRRSGASRDAVVMEIERALSQAYNDAYNRGRASTFYDSSTDGCDADQTGRFAGATARRKLTEKYCKAIRRSAPWSTLYNALRIYKLRSEIDEMASIASALRESIATDQMEVHSAMAKKKQLKAALVEERRRQAKEQGG